MKRKTSFPFAFRSFIRNFALVKLSVVIPVYGVERTLERCVMSVLGQGVPDMEVILVDDGSPDGSGKLCDKMAEENGAVTVIHRENGGLSEARNTGLALAKGHYVTFVDSDDEVAPGTYRPLLDFLALHSGVDILEYNMVKHYGTPQAAHLQPGDRLFENGDDYWFQTRAYGHAYACNKIFRRGLFDHVRFPRGKAFEDAWTLPALLDRATAVATTSLGDYLYYENAGGITRRAGAEALRSLLDAHVAAMANHRHWPACDGFTDYYMHAVNIQLDVYGETGEVVLPDLSAKIKPLYTNGLKNRLKALTIKLLGIKHLCRIHKTCRLLW